MPRDAPYGKRPTESDIIAAPREDRYEVIAESIEWDER